MMNEKIADMIISNLFWFGRQLRMNFVKMFFY